MRTLFVALAGACAIGSPSLGVIVQGTELAPYLAVSNQLAMSHGAVFSSQNYPAVTFTELMPGLWGIQGCETWALPANGGWYNPTIIVRFVDPADGVTPAVVNSVTAMWGDGGGDFDAVDMRAYDVANNLIASQTFTGNTFTQIGLTAAGINRVEFSANTNVGAGTSDTGLDWLQYPTPVAVPGPGSVVVLGGVVLLARRRR